MMHAYSERDYLTHACSERVYWMHLHETLFLCIDTFTERLLDVCMFRETFTCASLGMFKESVQREMRMCESLGMFPLAHVCSNAHV